MKPVNPRRFAFSLLTVVLPLAVAVSMLLVEAAPGQAVRTPTLKERLTFGLQVRLPVEREFIDAVVKGVEEGKVPQTLVDSTFFWARRRTPVRQSRFARRPIIYFQPALEIQLARLGIEIGTPRLSFFSRTF